MIVTRDREPFVPGVAWLGTGGVQVGRMLVLGGAWWSLGFVATHSHGASTSIFTPMVTGGRPIRSGARSWWPRGGRISDEVRALAAAGMRPHEALAAASWEARAYLGLPGLEPGAPADAVVYAEDPRLDLNRLADPTAVILRGQCVRGRR
jgi:hypothetical protein